MQDIHFAGMLEVAKGIKKLQTKNPNAAGWHLLNAETKFLENDTIEKMKRDQARMKNNQSPKGPGDAND